MIATKHLTKAQRILQEHCYNCRNKGPGCAVCHISQAMEEIESAQAAAPEKTENVSTGGHRPVCCKCNCEMRPEKNDIGVLDRNLNGSCQVWSADKWKCPECGVEIVIGFGWNAMVQQFEPSFDAHVKRYRDTATLIDNYERRE